MTALPCVFAVAVRFFCAPGAPFRTARVPATATSARPVVRTRKGPCEAVSAFRGATSQHAAIRSRGMPLCGICCLSYITLLDPALPPLLGHQAIFACVAAAFPLRRVRGHRSGLELRSGCSRRRSCRRAGQLQPIGSPVNPPRPGVLILLGTRRSGWRGIREPPNRSSRGLHLGIFPIQHNRAAVGTMLDSRL